MKNGKLNHRQRFLKEDIMYRNALKVSLETRFEHDKDDHVFILHNKNTERQLCPAKEIKIRCIMPLLHNMRINPIKAYQKHGLKFRPHLLCIRSSFDSTQMLRQSNFTVYTHASDPVQNLFG